MTPQILNYSGLPCYLRVDVYTASNGIALTLVAAETIPEAHLFEGEEVERITFNPEGIVLANDEIAIKSWDGHEPMAGFLFNEGIVESAHRYIRQNWVSGIPVCRMKPKILAYIIEGAEYLEGIVQAVAPDSQDSDASASSQTSQTQ